MQRSLQTAQRAFLTGTGSSTYEIDAIEAEVLAKYRTLTDHVRGIKSRPESSSPQNAPHVGRVDRRIKRAINGFQQQQSLYRGEVQDQQRRQYLIVNPSATDAELRDITEATQIFQQALLSTDRRGQSQSALQHVQERHNAIQHLEKSLIELSQLFQELDVITIQQGHAIQAVEIHTDDTQNNVLEANVQLDGAIDRARAARKKKWICFGIVVAIIIVIIIIVLVILNALHLLTPKNNS